MTEIIIIIIKSSFKPEAIPACITRPLSHCRKLVSCRLFIFLPLKSLDHVVFAEASRSFSLAAILVEHWLCCTRSVISGRPITDDFSYQPITGDVSFHATKMLYHSSCFLLFPWLPRRHWAAQPMKLRPVIYVRGR